MVKKVRYYSLDFDGCLSNEAFFDALARIEIDDSGKKKPWTEYASESQVNLALIEANLQFLESIKSTHTDEIADEFVIVGSNRQNLLIDWGNGSKSHSPTGSVFPRLKSIAQFLGAKLDKFLIGDIEAGKPFGTGFDQVSNSSRLNANGSYKNSHINQIETDPINSKLVDDATKVSTLFAQMQKVSMEHPEQEIDFNFYDDRRDIIEGLISFFGQHPELIPINVVFSLNGYSGPRTESTQRSRNETVYDFGPAQRVASIQGNGAIPKTILEWSSFYKTMKDILIAERTEQGVDYLSHINVAKDFTPQKLFYKYTKDGVPLEKVPKLAQDFIASEHLHHLIQGLNTGDEGYFKQFFKLSHVVQERVQIRLHELNMDFSKPLLETIHKESHFRILLEQMDKIQKDPGSVRHQFQREIIKELSKRPDKLEEIRFRYDKPNKHIMDILSEAAAYAFLAKYDAIEDKTLEKDRVDQLVQEYFTLSEDEKHQVIVKAHTVGYQQLRERIHNQDNANACVMKLDAWQNKVVSFDQRRFEGMVKFLLDNPKVESMVRDHFQGMGAGKSKELFVEIDKLKNGADKQPQFKEIIKDQRSANSPDSLEREDATPYRK